MSFAGVIFPPPRRKPRGRECPGAPLPIPPLLPRPPCPHYQATYCSGRLTLLDPAQAEAIWTNGYFGQVVKAAAGEGGRLRPKKWRLVEAEGLRDEKWFKVEREAARQREKSGVEGGGGEVEEEEKEEDDMKEERRKEVEEEKEKKEEEEDMKEERREDVEEKEKKEEKEEKEETREEVEKEEEEKREEEAEENDDMEERGREVEAKRREEKEEGGDKIEEEKEEEEDKKRKNVEETQEIEERETLEVERDERGEESKEEEMKEEEKERGNTNKRKIEVEKEENVKRRQFEEEEEEEERENTKRKIKEEEEENTKKKRQSEEQVTENTRTNKHDEEEIDNKSETTNEKDTKTNENYEAEPWRTVAVLSSDQQPAKTNDIDDKNTCLTLLPEEAMFLSYALGCLVLTYEETEDTEDTSKGTERRTGRTTHTHEMTIDEMWRVFTRDDPAFPVKYTAYHHYRTLGWVVKAGLKYGVDYVLYPVGPPQHHSQHTVKVVSVWADTLTLDTTLPGPALTWPTTATTQRLANHVNKNALLCLVLRPRTLSQRRLALITCLKELKVQELALTRWNPTDGSE